MAKAKKVFSEEDFAKGIAAFEKFLLAFNAVRASSQFKNFSKESCGRLRSALDDYRKRVPIRVHQQVLQFREGSDPVTWAESMLKKNKS